MSEQLSDNELDQLVGDGDLDLNAASGEAVAEEAPRSQKPDLSFFGNLPVKVTLEVASTEIPLKDLMEVDASSVIVLDKLAGEPLDVKVNGALFAKAEVVVMNGNYGLRILELNGASLSDLTS